MAGSEALPPLNEGGNDPIIDMKFPGYQSYVDVAVASLRAEFLAKAEEIRIAEVESDKELARNVGAIQTNMTNELENFLMTTVTITQSGADKLLVQIEDARKQAQEVLEKSREVQRKRSGELLENMLESVAKKFDDELEGHQGRMSIRFSEARESLGGRLAGMRKAKEIELSEKYALNRELMNDHNRAVEAKAALEVKKESERLALLWQPVKEELEALKKKHELLEYKLRNADKAKEDALKRLEFYEPPLIGKPRESVSGDNQWGFLDDSLLSTLVEVGIRRGNLSAASLVSQATFAKRQYEAGIYHDTNNSNNGGGGGGGGAVPILKDSNSLNSPSGNQSSGRFPSITRNASNLDMDDGRRGRSRGRQIAGGGRHKSSSASPIPSPIPSPASSPRNGSSSSSSRQGSRSLSRSKDHKGFKDHKKSFRDSPSTIKELKSNKSGSSRSKTKRGHSSKRSLSSSSSSSSSSNMSDSFNNGSISENGKGNSWNYGNNRNDRNNSLGSSGSFRRNSGGGGIQEEKGSNHGGMGGSSSSGGTSLSNVGGLEATFGVGSGGMLITSGTVNMNKEMLLLKGTICALKYKCDELNQSNEKNATLLKELQQSTLPLLRTQLVVETKRASIMQQKMADLATENKSQKKQLSDQETMLKEMTKRETILRDSLEGSMGTKALEAALAFSEGGNFESVSKSRRNSLIRKTSNRATPVVTPRGPTLAATNALQSRNTSRSSEGRSSTGSNDGVGMGHMKLKEKGHMHPISSGDQKLSKINLSLEGNNMSDVLDGHHSNIQYDSHAPSVDLSLQAAVALEVPETPSTPVKKSGGFTRASNSQENQHGIVDKVKGTEAKEGNKSRDKDKSFEKEKALSSKSVKRIQDEEAAEKDIEMASSNISSYLLASVAKPGTPPLQTTNNPTSSIPNKLSTSNKSLSESSSSSSSSSSGSSSASHEGSSSCASSTTSSNNSSSASSASSSRANGSHANLREGQYATGGDMLMSSIDRANDDVSIISNDYDHVNGAHNPMHDSRFGSGSRKASSVLQTDEDDIIKEEQESTEESRSTRYMEDPLEEDDERTYNEDREGLGYGPTGGSEFDPSSESQVRHLASEHSGQHVSYLEEQHFKERSELAKQMARLALESQEKYMLLKSLTDALRKQKQSNALLEAQLIQAAKLKSSRLGEREDNRGGRFVSHSTAVQRTSFSRSVVPVGTAQVEIPTSVPTTPDMKRSNSADKGREPSHLVPNVDSMSKSVGHQTRVDKSIGVRGDGSGLIPHQIETLPRDIPQTNEKMNREEGGRDQPPLVASEESRDLLKRSFLMHKTPSQAHCLVNTGGQGLNEQHMSLSQTPMTMGGDAMVGIQHQQGGKYMNSTIPSGSGRGVVDGFGSSGKRGGAKGSRLGNAPKSKNAKSSYESRLF